MRRLTALDDRNLSYWMPVLARRRGRTFFVVIAVVPWTFPNLNLFRVVDFRKVKCVSTHWTKLNRRPRAIEVTVGEIRVAKAIPKDTIATAPFALMERLSVF